MLTEWRRERFIRKILRKISRQRVVIVGRFGGPWVIERAVSEGDEDVTEALRTCHLRGWVEVLHDQLPRERLGPGGTLPTTIEGVAPLYRVTEAGFRCARHRGVRRIH